MYLKIAGTKGGQSPGVQIQNIVQCMPYGKPVINGGRYFCNDLAGERGQRD